MAVCVLPMPPNPLSAYDCVSAARCLWPSWACSRSSNWLRPVKKGLRAKGIFQGDSGFELLSLCWTLLSESDGVICWVAYEPAPTSTWLACCKEWAKSCTEAKRSLGSLASARSTTASTVDGRAGTCSHKEGG